MPLYEVSWTQQTRNMAGFGPRLTRKVVAAGPIAAALKAGRAVRVDSSRVELQDVSVEQLDADLAWDDRSVTPDESQIVSHPVPRPPGVRSVKLSAKERFDLASWLKLPVGHVFVVGDGRLVVDPQQDGGMAVRVFR